MRTHTSEYKTSLQGVRETLSILTNITTNTEISESELNRIKPILNAELLKSTMRELNIESKIDIPLETELNLQFGVKTRYEEVEDERDNYDFIDYGNYIVYESEYQADTKLYIITCYDKMLYSMVDYEAMEITYPITIRNYIKAIATHLGLEFANENDEFANYDKEIPNELYLDTNGRSLGYTFRDVLDELSQVTASNICINENDELEVRYINDNISSTATKTGTNINITDNKLSKILNLQLLGDTNQTGTPSPSSPVNIDTVTGQQDIFVIGTNYFNAEAISNTNIVVSDEGKTITMPIVTSGNGYTLTNATLKELCPALQVNDEVYLNASNNVNNNKFIYLSSSDYLWDYGTKKTITETDLISSVALYANRYHSGDTTQKIISDLRITKESTDEFKPYKNKIYGINLGKNLLGLTNGDKTAGGITGTWNNGNFVYSGTASNTYSAPTNSTNIKLPAGNYVFSISQALTIQCRLKLTYADNTSQDITIAVGDLSKSFTTTKEIKWIYVWLNGLTVDTYYEGNINCMLEKGTTPTGYAPYFTPIELNKIGDYQDKIKKSTGKNLFDEEYPDINSNLTYKSIYVGDGTFTMSTTMPLNTQDNANLFFLTGEVTTGASTGTNGVYINRPITIQSTNGYVSIAYRNTASTDPNNYNTIIEKNFTATEYEPYGKVWYIHKEIGKVVLDGTQGFGDNGVSGNIHEFVYSGSTDKMYGVTNILSNYFGTSTSNAERISGRSNNSNLYFRINRTTADTTAQFKTWLSTHNTIVYYVLATPTNTIITNETLINELEQASKLKLYDGINNVIVNGNLGSVLSFNYVTGIETIDENYLKNINVNFGEKYGPVNSIVLSRAGESDNVYLRDEQSVTEDGLCEIKISENQIMNFNDRSNYLPDILNQLDGLEYYLNDFSSTGITYLDVCDGYGVKIGDTTYNCIMFNDEINITQGLSEDVYTELPEETITDYKKADKTDRKINQAYIIVNKQNQKIEALTSRTEVVENNQDIQYLELTNKFNNYATLNNINTITNQVTQLQTDTYTKTQIQQIANGDGYDYSLTTDTNYLADKEYYSYDDTNKTYILLIAGTDYTVGDAISGDVYNKYSVTVTAVISTEAQFDADGMHYSKTGADTSSTINEIGLRVDDKGGNEIFFSGYDNVQGSLTEGTSIVRSDNLNVKTYLQVGNNKGRFEEYTDDDGNTGVGFFLT